MFSNNFAFSQNVHLSKKALGVSILRKQVIANNIANVDTPNYKRHMVSFESELNRAIDSNMKPAYPAKMNDSRHIPFDRAKNPLGVKPRVQVEFDTNYRNDKNNVDIEKEISDEIKNSLYFTAVTQSVNNSFRRLKTVLA